MAGVKKERTPKKKETQAKSVPAEKPLNGNAGNRFQAILEHIEDGYYETDLEGNFTYFNEAFRKLTACTREQLFGMHSLRHAADRENARKVQSIYEEICRTGKPITTYEWDVIREDGERRTVEVSATLIRDEKGAPVGFGGISRDITDRKRSEAVLREREAKIESVLSAAPVGIGVSVNRVMTEFNQRFCEITGYSRDELLDSNTEMLYPSRDEYERVGQAIYPKIEQEGKGAVETKFRRKDGKLIDVLISSVLLDPKDSSRGTTFTILDISAQKQAESARQEAVGRVNEIIEFLPDATFVIDLEGTVIAWNRAIEEMTGVRKEDMIGKGNYEYALPFYNRRRPIAIDLILSPDLTDSAYDAVQKNRDRMYAEAYAPGTYQGRGAYLSASVSILHDAAGNTIGAIESIRDITERKRAEEEKRRNEARLRSIITVLQHRSEGTKSFLDFALEEAITLTGSRIGYIFFYDETRKEFTLNSWSRDVAEACAITQTQTIRQLDGTGFWGEAVRQRRPIIVNDFAAPHPLKKGYPQGHAPLFRYMTLPVFRGERIVAVVGLANKETDYDNTDVLQALLLMESVWQVVERERAEEALRESEERFRHAFEGANMGVCVIGLDGKLLRVNPQLSRMFGYLPDEMEGKAVNDFTHPEDLHISPAFFESSISGKIGHNTFEKQYIHHQGHTLWGEVSISLVRDPRGNPLYFVSHILDITDRKKAEQERRGLEERLQRAEKMEALGTLAGGVAHDLNNVLGIVIGYSELLLRMEKEGGPLRRPLENIVKSGEKAAAIVQDLLTMARRGVASRKVLNLNAIISEFQHSPEFSKISAEHPDLTIETEMDPDLLNMAGSPVHVGKMLFNLIANAAEAMPKGGRITITTANQYLDRPIRGYDSVQEGDYVVLNVSDTGEGISSTDLKRIFEPFYTKKIMGRSGTGLGLAVVWGTVKDHHGYINVQSEEKKGSSFTAYFPVCREAIERAALPLAVSEYAGKGETILVIDDIAGQRELASEMLRLLNYSVASVSSGEEAVLYLKQKAVDLVVLDMIMDPGMDGLDTYNRILEIRPGQRAIIVSGFSESQRVLQAQELGAGSYVRKPYVLEKLGVAVREELDRAFKRECVS